MKTDLHVPALGEGDPIVFIHGGFGGSEGTFVEQRELADQFRLLFVDRKGYGDSPPAERLDFDSQAADIASVLDDGAHLGQAVQRSPQGFPARSHTRRLNR